MESVTAVEPTTPAPTCSPAKLAANRANAAKSTGPRTPEGKRRSSLNATTHGLRSSNPKPTLPTESQEAFQSFRDHLHKDHQPQTALESALVDRLASLLWRLNRIPSIECDLIETELITHATGHVLKQNRLLPEDRTDYTAPSPATLLAQHFLDHDDASNPLTRLARYETTLARAAERTLASLRTLKRDRPETPTPDPAADDDADLPNEPTDHRDAGVSPAQPESELPNEPTDDRGTGLQPVLPSPEFPNQLTDHRDAGVSPAQPESESPNEPTDDRGTDLQPVLPSPELPNQLTDHRDAGVSPAKSSSPIFPNEPTPRPALPPHLPTHPR